MAGVWEEICNLVIRPQRCIYDSSIMLGPRLFMLGNRIYERKDLDLKNKKGLTLKCSHYMPIDSQRKSEKLPCVVYLHGNCGSRCDAIETVQLLLPYDITVFSFDFAGSGLSEGDFVSLGYFEQHDVGAVLDHLVSENRTSKIGLWGRSMGASTAIISASCYCDVVCGCVCDSPFSSLEKVILDLVKKYAGLIPKGLTKIGIKMMKTSIKKRAGFDIYENNPIKYARTATAPVLFAAAFGDHFIQIAQSEELFETWNGEKGIIRFEGDHNSERPEFFYDAVAIFFYNVLISNDQKLKLKDPFKRRLKKSVMKRAAGEKHKKRRSEESGEEELEDEEELEEEENFNLSEEEEEDEGAMERRIEREVVVEELEDEESCGSSVGSMGRSPSSVRGKQIEIPSSFHDGSLRGLELESLVRDLEESLEKEEDDEEKMKLRGQIEKVKERMK